MSHPTDNKVSTNVNVMDAHKQLDYKHEKHVDNTKDKSIMKRVRFIISNTTVEPMVFLHAASVTIIFLVAQSLKVYKVCRGTFGHSEDVCLNLRTNSSLEEESQRVAADLGMYWIIVQTVPSTILTLLLGPWSDTFGRKILLLLPLMGSILGGFVLIAASQFDELPAEFLLLCPALIGVSGGFMTLVVAVFSYISDISSPESRTVRMGFITGLWFLGSPVGSALAGVLIAHTNYVTCFSLATAFWILCLAYVYFGVKDSIRRPDSISRLSVLKQFCNCNNCKDIFVTTLKKRPDHKHIHLWLLIFCVCALYLPTIGEGNVRYLYARFKFDWQDDTYSYYQAMQMAVGALVAIFILPIFTNKMKLGDIFIALLAIVARIISELIVAFSSTSWMMFLSPITLIGECAGPPMRSLMTTCVQPNEIGKMFTMLAVVEVGIPTASSIMYSQVYNATMHIHCCGVVFLITAYIYILVFLALIWIRYDIRKMFGTKDPQDTKNHEGISKLNADMSTNEKCHSNKQTNICYDNASFDHLETEPPEKISALKQIHN